jgi:hypothetical protein
MSFEIYNNFNESIFCTTIINGKIERTKINSKQGHIIVFVTNCTEIRIYFGNPYGFTSLWGVNYEGNNHVLDLFYMTKSNYINVPNEK